MLIGQSEMILIHKDLSGIFIRFSNNLLDLSSNLMNLSGIFSDVSCII